MTTSVAAVIQMTTSPDVQANLAIARGLLERAHTQGAVLAALPENFAIMGRKEADKVAVAEIAGEGPIQAFLGHTARELGMWIVGGTIPIRDEAEPERVAAASLVFDERGRNVARYDKIHLFDVDLPTGESWRESNVYKHGIEAVVVTGTPVGTLGLTICYDLRFPALFARLAEAGADLIAVPAAFTVPTGKAHWEMLLRARAIEAGLFVVAAAQVGHHEDGRNTYGHSLVVDPWGELLLDMGDRSGVSFAEVDLSRITEVRSRVPAISHRRPVAEAVSQ
jgi:predicted amidohydrolase